MSAAILAWLGGHDTGASSKAIALTALGSMPPGAATSYPGDGGDFGRCYRLLLAAPEARAGLDKLSVDGGPCWKALHEAWDELTKAYVARDGKIYDQMRAILQPIEEKDRGHIRLSPGVSIRFGGR